MKAAKNTLQEIFQKSRCRLPRYYTREEGEAKWISTVDIFDHKGDVVMNITGDIFNSKSAAESDVATKALNRLSDLELNKPQPPKIRLNLNRNVALFIDVENAPRAIVEIMTLIEHNPNLKIFAFFGQKHVVSSLSWDNYIWKIAVNVNGADSVDICMIMYCSILLSNKFCDDYIIYTQDHFGETLVNLIHDKTMLWPPANAYIVGSTNELLNVLKGGLIPSQIKNV